MSKNTTDEADMISASSGAVEPSRVQNTALSLTYGSYLQTLPTTRTLPKEAIAELDTEEGIHPAAVERMSSDPRKSIYDILKLVLTAVLFVSVLYCFFPWKYFLKPPLREIAISPPTQRLTDKDVKDRGGVDRLTNVERAVYEISSLRDKGSLTLARDKCAYYIDRLQSPDEYPVWIPVWRHYLELLNLKQQSDILVAQCERLQKGVPDSPEAVYYPAYIKVQTVPCLDSYDKKEKNAYKQTLKALISDCQVAEASLAERKSDPDATVMLNGFRLLLADIFRRQWWVSEFSWDDESRERAFEYLRKLPADSKEAVEMHLSLLRKCEQNWYHFWRKDPKTRVIDGSSITYANLKTMIQREESR